MTTLERQYLGWLLFSNSYQLRHDDGTMCGWCQKKFEGDWMHNDCNRMYQYMMYELGKTDAEKVHSEYMQLEVTES